MMFQKYSISSLHSASTITVTDKTPPLQVSVDKTKEGQGGGFVSLPKAGRVRLAIHASSVVRMAAVVEAPPFRQVRIGIVRLRATIQTYF